MCRAGYPEPRLRTMYQCVDAVAIMLMRTTVPLAAPPGVPGGVAAGVAATSGSIQLPPRRPGRTRQLPARSWPEGLVWCSVRSRRFAARLSGLASGLALAVRPAGLAEVSGAQGRVLKIVLRSG